MHYSHNIITYQYQVTFPDLKRLNSSKLTLENANGSTNVFHLASIEALHLSLRTKATETFTVLQMGTKVLHMLFSL